MRKTYLFCLFVLLSLLFLHCMRWLCLLSIPLWLNLVKLSMSSCAATIHLLCGCIDAACSVCKLPFTTPQQALQCETMVMQVKLSLHQPNLSFQRLLDNADEQSSCWGVAVYLSTTSAYVSVSHASSASALARCSVRAVPSHGASALLCSDCSALGTIQTSW